MKTILTVILSLFVLSAGSQTDFGRYFEEHTLRLDYYHAGTDTSEAVYFKELRKEPHWGGTKQNLVDSFFYGKYYVKVFDVGTDQLIYSYGFCSLFEEWQCTDEATHLQRSFPESLIMPFPKDKVRIELLSRDSNNSFAKLFELTVDPTDVNINKEASVSAEVRKIRFCQSSDKALDLVFIGDGYTKNELPKFYARVNEIADYLLATSPFTENKNNINVWAVGAVSAESGTDIPQNDLWRTTALNSGFNTFGIERYLTTSDYHAVRNYAALAPADHVCVIVNTNVYGGGGIYNFWNLTAANHKASNEVFVHELGHSLAALADEYSEDETATDDLHNKNVEPYNANITTLVDFNKKWRNMMDKNTPIPTPIINENNDVVGVYEGAGYQAKGIYRPFINCKMRALNYEFCPVCKKAINTVIQNYTR